MTQAEALSILKTGSNIFLTGDPGSGKTYTVNEYISYLRRHAIEPAVTASTGIAATHLGGMTLHSWGGLQPKTTFHKKDLEFIASKKYVADRVSRAKVLVIDEISMLSPEVLTMIERICRAVRQNSRPFGGMQIVMVGDFFQLPPIGGKPPLNRSAGSLFEEGNAQFAYDAPVWERANPRVCYLTQQYRQDDTEFLALLAAIRRSEFGNDDMRKIETRKIDPSASPSGIPNLFTHNRDVDSYNNGELAKLPGQRHVFQMSSRGPRAAVAALAKGCLSPEELNLKVGAVVMFTKNNQKKQFVNGTLGSITGFDRNQGYPIVQTREGRNIIVEHAEWTIQEEGKIRAQITQLPLRLAWAITVHKSQGISLDEAVMDLRRVFEYGQGYVALSRVRRLSGLYLLGWNPRAFEINPGVLKKDQSFRVQSEQIAQVLDKMSGDEITHAHHQFIRACGGKIAREQRPDARAGLHYGSSGFDKIREKHASAYFPWDETQDDALRQLFSGGVSVAELAKKFSRTEGAIRSRLIKLELMNG